MSCSYYYSNVQIFDDNFFAFLNEFTIVSIKTDRNIFFKLFSFGLESRTFHKLTLDKDVNPKWFLRKS